MQQKAKWKRTVIFKAKIKYEIRERQETWTRERTTNELTSSKLTTTVEWRSCRSGAVDN